ncbi:hypothetical protein PV327_000085 [Microctonus hyperodae]|uniref:Short neuropeptide F n=1 Tax=Microctonus hyperodae TaxID=165561 RepID=A0AA39L1Y6_MICHY|nr:hypothetical protein PV327_000085 [Microctonus hyperodae]
MSSNLFPLSIMMRNYTCAIVFFLILGVAVGTEHYMDYGGGNKIKNIEVNLIYPVAVAYKYHCQENADRDLENLREFYRLLLRRNSFDNNVGSPMPMGSPYEHLMIRKSQRSPSLRLRFGRSGPAMPPARLLARSDSSDTTFEDN